jgi:drug/metabolite transporter (DMT)-like permease
VARSALLGLLETVLGPLWVWLLLREQPGAASLAGGVLILAALLANTLVDVVAPARASAIVRGEQVQGPGASKVTGGNR